MVGARDGKKLRLSWDHVFSIPTHPNRGCSKLLPKGVCRTAPSTPGLLIILFRIFIGVSVQIMEGLGLNRILVVKLKVNLRVGFVKYWLLEYKQTNKQSEHITTKDFINLQFLPKLSSQKPFSDEARLSSLVNTRFAASEPIPLE